MYADKSHVYTRCEATVIGARGSVQVSAKTSKAMPGRPCRPEDLQKYLNCWSCKSIACLNSRNQCNHHKLLPVQQELQMLPLLVHPLYCHSGAEDLQISRSLMLSYVTRSCMSSLANHFPLYGQCHNEHSHNFLFCRKLFDITLFIYHNS